MRNSAGEDEARARWCVSPGVMESFPWDRTRADVSEHGCTWGPASWGSRGKVVPSCTAQQPQPKDFPLLRTKAIKSEQSANGSGGLQLLLLFRVFWSSYDDVSLSEGFVSPSLHLRVLEPEYLMHTHGSGPGRFSPSPAACVPRASSCRRSPG